MPRIHTASLDDVPSGQLTAAFVTIHIATDGVAAVMKFMSEEGKKAVWVKNARSIEIRQEFDSILKNFIDMGLIK